MAHRDRAGGRHRPVVDPHGTDARLSVGPSEVGTIVRTLELPPDEDSRSDTVDYAIVLRGEIYTVMDSTEVEVTAGDVLAQRGTPDARANRSDGSCLPAFVLTGGGLPA